MVISRVLSRVSRTAGAGSLFLSGSKELQAPSFATQFHFRLSEYPLFMRLAALSSSSILSKPDLKKTTDNHSAAREELEQMKSSIRQLELKRSKLNEEIQQLKPKSEKCWGIL
ncbi:hypothetical protein PTKIN_Ptkin14bG0036200 [Pterospermum kingtungense]